MAHLTKISAGKFSSLDYVLATSGVNAVSSLADITAQFVTAANQIATTTSTDGSPQTETLESGVVHVGNVREFPSIGTPANVVNVPVYGQSTSSQVAGQSDAPSLEFSLNYVATDHSALESLRKSSARVCFRVRMSDVSLLTSLANAGCPVAYADQEFGDFYFFGTIASFEITTGLTDAIQATITLTVSGDFTGPVSLPTAGGVIYTDLSA